MTTKRQKGNEDVTFGDVLRGTAAVITGGGYVARYNRRTEQYVLWFKDVQLASSPNEAEIAGKLKNILGEPDFANT